MSYSNTKTLVLMKFYNGTRQYSKYWGSTTEEKPSQMYLVRSTGEVYVVGRAVTGGAISTNQGGDDIYVVKFNSDGSVAWSNAYGSTAADRGFGIAVIGTVICITGSSDSSTWLNSANGAKTDIFIMGLSTTDGSIVWANTYGGNQDDTGVRIVAAADNLFYVGGYSYSADIGTTSADFICMRMGTNGVVSYFKRYGGNAEDFLKDIKVFG